MTRGRDRHVCNVFVADKYMDLLLLTIRGANVSNTCIGTWIKYIKGICLSRLYKGDYVFCCSAYSTKGVELECLAA